MKKVLSLLLAATMAAGMATVGFAATGKKITDIHDSSLELSYRKDPTIGTSFANHPAATVSNQTVSYSNNIIPHSKVTDSIDLYRSMFLWDGDTPDNQRLTSNEIRAAKLDVRTSNSSGSKAVDKISIDSRTGVIEIKYVEEYVSTKDLDFDFTIYLTIDGKRKTSAGLTFTGTLANETTPVYQGDDYVDTSAGQVAEAQDNIRSIEVDMGGGVSIFAKMTKDKKYYGTTSQNPDDADNKVFQKYKDIDNVVQLKTVGLNQSGDIVKLATDSSEYYVYDSDLNYLGRSNEMLPYSTKYYLAGRKLDVSGSGTIVDEDDTSEPDVDTDGEPEPDDGGPDGGNGGGAGNGGGTGSGGTGGINPDTGSTSFISVAVAAAVLSLGAALAVSRKKKSR